jgi:hypothetical protein
MDIAIRQKGEPMQKRKFDELVSYFNKKVSEMEIGTKYKMELLGMVTALGCAHEKEMSDLSETKRDSSDLDEWCDTCREYDSERHCCPRYNRVIREAVEEVKADDDWIPCSERLPDLLDERYLVSLAGGGVGVMEYKSTGFHNYGSFSPVPIETVTAWMPLPEPWKGEQDESD